MFNPLDSLECELLSTRSQADVEYSILLDDKHHVTLQQSQILSPSLQKKQC